MVRSDVETMVRAQTGHDSDTQVTQAQIYAWLLLDYPAFRREIIDVAPSLYTAVATVQVLTAADPDFDLPADFERVNMFEVLVGADYIDVPVAGGPGADFRGISYREEAGVLRVAPSGSAPGTYKLTYNKAPTLTSDYTIEVPAGCELVIVERLCARVRGRFNEDPSPHIAEANRIWHGVPGVPGSGQKTAIRRRYGGHTQSAFVQTRGW
jgi:hypothetical protein